MLTHRYTCTNQLLGALIHSLCSLSCLLHRLMHSPLTPTRLPAVLPHPLQLPLPSSLSLVHTYISAIKVKHIETTSSFSLVKTLDLY